MLRPKHPRCLPPHRRIITERDNVNFKTQTSHTNTKRSSSMKITAIAEKSLWLLGLYFLASFGIDRLMQNSLASESIRNFEDTTSRSSYIKKTHTSDTNSLLTDERTQQIKTDLWSKDRIIDYKKLEGDLTYSAIGVLNIKPLALTVPIFTGTDEAVLDRGAGWVTQTTALHGKGNIGIAAHRDSFFRPLKDIKIGHVIHLKTYSGERKFKVASTSIVSPDQIEVLNATQESQLTLITCYPFYFVGKAPKRFIVTAIEIP